MDKYIYTNSNLIFNLMINIINLSVEKQKKNKCDICNKEYDNIYYYKLKNSKIIILEVDIHMLKKHNIINTILYKEICNVDNLNSDIYWCKFNINDLNIMDGLYSVGSEQIYMEKNKNIHESKIYRFSEHAGLIHFYQNKISKISIITGYRVEQSDPIIFMPKNNAEALEVDYIFHTHPKTPYIGSRIKYGIVYEFPSISDISHFIEHHNGGKLLGSLVVAPEGIYIIRKNKFDRNIIHVDYDIMINELENIFSNCYNDSYLKYSIINYNELKLNGEIKLPDNFFYSQISRNYEYINKINKILEKYDIFIEYYARILFDKPEIFTNKWIFDDIYIPRV